MVREPAQALRFPPLQPEQLPDLPGELDAHAFLSQIENTMIDSIVKWLEGLEPEEGTSVS